MAAFGLLLVLTAVIGTVELRTLSDTGIEKSNATIDGVKAKFSSAEFFYLDDPLPGDFFDSIASAAKILTSIYNVSNDEVIATQKAIQEAFTSLFQDASSTTDEQAAPFGLDECCLLPANLSDIDFIPIISASLNAMRATLRDYDGMMKACEKSNVDDALKTLSALIGEECEGGLGQNVTLVATMQESMMRYAEDHQFEGGSENNCLHLFVARYTKSPEAVQMFKKSFDKYLMATVAAQAVCWEFTPKCDEDECRQKVLDAHTPKAWSFAESLARTASIQLNDTTLRRCDHSQEVIISNTTAASERVKQSWAR